MSQHFRRKKVCRFSNDDSAVIDYKDIAMLKNYITETGWSYCS